MARVGVILSKSEGGVGVKPTVTTGGNMGFMMDMSPENVDYTQYGAGAEGGSAAKEAAARKFGNIGSKARIGLGALGAFNAMYNATSSGQPGAIAAAGQGGMSGYYGSQGLEGWAAKQGAAHGARQEQRAEKVAVKEAADARQRQEGMANYQQGAAAPHSSKGGEGMTRDYAHGPYSPVPEASFDGSMFDNMNYQAPKQNPPALQRRIDNAKNSPEAVALREERAQNRVASANRTLSGESPFGAGRKMGDLGGRGNPNMFSSTSGSSKRHAETMKPFQPPPPEDPTAGTDSLGGLGDAMQGQGITGEVPPPQPTTQATLGQFGQQADKSKQVAVLDPNRLKQMENQGVDENGNTISGNTKVQGG